MTQESLSDRIAIVGIACRVPGARSPDELWRNLRDGVESIRRFSRDELLAAGLPASLIDQPNYVPAAGVLDDIEHFDGELFGFNTREAELTDPQQRLFLECAWQAFESAGYDPRRVPGAVGVFAGAGANAYLPRFSDGPLRLDTPLGYQTMIGNDKDFLATRVSYKLNLRGPSLTVQSACSTSLVAVHMACESLLNRQCDLALAGAVALRVPHHVGYLHAEGGILSRDGHCRPFDAEASGTVGGNGVGAVVLRRLDDALAAGDHIWAVIRGSAINNDGAAKVGYTAPSIDGQSAVIAEALAVAGVDPGEVSYVEAHGTGTALGDPVEVAALTRAYGDGARTQPCTLGAVKGNLGHLDVAAGMAGLIKTVMALRAKQLPPTLHYQRTNPQIELERTPFRVSGELRDWTCDGPRIAGVSSFGIGGTNAHVIVEEAPVVTRVDAPRSHELLVVSAASKEALGEASERLATALETAGAPLADVAFTVQRGRHPFAHRRFVVARDAADGAALLRGPDGARSGSAEAGAPPRPVMMFTGQGSVYPGMGQRLFAAERVFRETLQRCAEVLGDRLGRPLLSVLFGDDAALLQQTAWAQPALFALEYALVAQWRAWGIEPAAVIGHSLGEYVAACVAGRFSLEDGLRLVAARGRLLQSLPAGGEMFAVHASAEAAARAVFAVDGAVSVAVINGDEDVVISGAAEAVRAAVARLPRAQQLAVSHAFHSPLVEPILDELHDLVAAVPMAPLQLPLVTNVTGKRAGADELDAAYWRRHAREPVQWLASLRALSADHHVFLEIGPRPQLSALARGVWAERAVVLPSLRDKRDDVEQMLHSLGRLHALGAEVAWDALHDGRAPRRVPMTGHVFQRQRYWMAALDRGAARATDDAGDPLLGRKRDGALDVYERDLVAEGELADHVVHGRVVMPAAGLVELAAAAAGAPIQAIEVREPLVVAPDAGRKLQLVVTGREPGERIKIFADADGGWRLHAVAEIAAPRAVTGEPLADVRARCAQVVDPAEFYTRLAALGLAYGPAFQRLDELALGDGEAIGRLRGDPSRALAGPVLDAAFQVLGAALAPVLKGSDEVYMPVAIEHVERFRDAPAAMFVHARLRNRAAELAVGDVWIVDEAGAPVARALGLSLRRAPRAALLRMLGHTVEAQLHQLRWQVDDAPLAARGHTGERWLVVGDGRGLAGALAARLRTAGATVDAIAADAALPDGRIDGVVHLAGVDLPDALSDELEHATGLDLVAAQRESCGSLLALIHALTRRGATPRLHVVTRGAQPVDDAPLAIAQAPLAGLCRTAMLEHPELAIACLDLDPGVSLDAAAEQLRLGLAADDQHTAFRAGKRFVHRLVRKEQPRQRLARPGDSFRLTSREKGTLDALTLAAVDRRPPGPGEVEITVHAAGLNFLDVMDALGVLPFERGGFGNECAGMIAAVGPGVTRFRVGDPVVAVGPGCMTRYITLPTDLVAHKPAALALHHAAGVPIILMTVELAFGEVARLQPGQSVLIHAAAGGVGLAAVRWAQRRGAQVFATAGSPRKRAFLRRLGVAHVFNSRSLDFAPALMAATGGRGVDVVLNSLAGDFVGPSLDVVAKNGTFLEIGKAGIWPIEQVAARRPDLAYHVVGLERLIAGDTAHVGALLHTALAGFATGESTLIPTRVVDVEDAPALFTAMQKGHHLGKLVLQFAPALPDGTYLLTGAFGGVGRLAARHLVARGARRLVLSGRRTPSPEIEQLATELRAAGATVELVVADIARRDDADRLVAAAGADLRGVLQLAGTLDDGVLAQQTWGRFVTTFTPKLAGGWNLHQATRHLALDFFVCFSSLSALGSPGQANYAAACAFEDALAHHRHALGLPALSVNWGPWSGVGMAARSDATRGHAGIRAHDPEHALTLLDRAIAEPGAQLVAVAADWRAHLAVLARAAGRVPSLMRALDAGAAAPAAGPSEFLARFTATPASLQREVMTLQLRTRVAAALGVAPPTVDVARPLMEMGIDSLVAIELRNQLSADVGRPLPATLLFNYTTVDALAAHLVELLAPAPAAEPPPPPLTAAITAAPSALEALLSEVEALSQDPS